MAFLTIDGVTYDVAVDGASEDGPEEVGKNRRAFSGNMRSSRRGIRRKWNFTIPHLTQTQFQLLQNKIYAGFWNCNGEAMGEVNVLCAISMNDGKFQQEGLGHLRSMSIQLIEVTTPPAIRMLTTIELTPTPVTLTI